MKLKKIYFIFTLLVLNILHASSGNKIIKIVGDLNSKAPKYTTPAKIEKEFIISKHNSYNPWEKRKDTYEGVFLTQLAKRYGNKNIKSITLKAFDDYEIEFKKELYENERILLAYKVNGKFIPIREKGPMRVVFIDYNNKEKKYELNLTKWLWMINTIEFNE